jgi:hypothetical protein
LTPAGYRRRAWLIGGLLAGTLLFLLFTPPLPQSLRYHQFADQRPFWSIPHAQNVLSNLPFVVFGMMGLVYVCRNRRFLPDGLFVAPWEWWSFLICFVSVVLTGFGSMYYHWQPGNDTLYWDRLPLTVVLMSFFVILIGERMGGWAGAWLLLPLVAAGVAAVTYWHWSEQQGHGDVRYYAVVQFFPMLAIPLLVILFPARYNRNADIVAILALYVAAKVLEALDRKIFALGQVVSGHTLKHLVASLTVLGMLRLLQNRALPQHRAGRVE